MEQFKSFFANAAGATNYQSSSESWAQTDLLVYMRELASNPPLFLEAFYDACESFQNDQYGVPGVELVNDICRNYGIKYQIRPPDLIRLGENEEIISMPDSLPNLAESSLQLLHESFRSAEQSLTREQPREAVYEMLWILESIATLFKDAPLASGTVKGKYFNDIAKELRNAYQGTSLDRMFDWASQLHGYLSSPTGGGVRHGIDLKDGKPITLAEGRFFCNLIRFYILFMISEHERLISSVPEDSQHTS